MFLFCDAIQEICHKFFLFVSFLDIFDVYLSQFPISIYVSFPLKLIAAFYFSLQYPIVSVVRLKNFCDICRVLWHMPADITYL